MAKTDWAMSAKSKLPPAMHALAAVHDTAVSELPLSACGLGTGTTVQAVPFQRSARGWYRTLGPGLANPPTAMHESSAAAQDTALNRTPPDPSGGVRWIAQVVPFQASARACPFGSAVLTENPAATHRRAAGQDTP